MACMVNIKYSKHFVYRNICNFGLVLKNQNTEKKVKFTILHKHVKLLDKTFQSL